MIVGCAALYNGLIHKIASINEYILLVFFLLSSLLFISNFSKLKLKNFNWNINIYTVIVVCITLTVWTMPDIIIRNSLDGTRFFTEYNKSVIKLIISCITTFIYPALYEEVIYRGYLISGLLSFGMEKWKVNIIQAFIFGLNHIISNQYGKVNLIFIIYVHHQKPNPRVY